VSSKSACKEGSDASYVVAAIGGTGRDSIRFSLGRDTEKDDINYTIGALRDIMLKYKQYR